MTSEMTDATDIAESQPLPTGDERPLIGTVRRGIFYLSLGLAAVMTVLFLPDLLMLSVLGWTATAGAELGIHRLHIMGIGTVATVALLGLFAQAYNPTERIASMWGVFLIMLVISIGTVGFGVGRPEEVLPFLGVTGLALITHPAGRNLFRRGDSYSPALLALVAIAAVPLLAFMLTQYTLTGNTADPHAIEGHYVMMAGLASPPSPTASSPRSVSPAGVSPPG